MVKHCIFLTLTLAILLAVPAGARDKFIISTQAIPPLSTEENDGFLDHLYHELGHRIGIEVETHHLPIKRGLLMADNGTNDGDGPRTMEIEKEYPNLVRVEEPVMTARVAAFSKLGTEISKWEDLAGLTVSYQKDWGAISQHLPESTKVVTVNSTHNGMSMLNARRVDVVLAIVELGDHEIQKHGFTAITRPSAPLIGNPLYLYLHKRHAKLLPAFSKALRDVKADGTWDRLLQEAIRAHHGAHSETHDH